MKAGMDLIPHLQAELLQAAETVAAPLSTGDRATLARLIDQLIERGSA